MHDSPQTLFDELADGYEEMRKELGWDPFVHIHAAFPPETLQNKRVLDAGCGTGECAQWLQSHGAEPYGLDISPEMCFAAAENSENIPYLTHDLSEPLPFDDKRFDIVIALGCLEYIEDIEATVAEFARVLDKGGCFLGCFERYGDDCPGGSAQSIEFFDDWMRFRQSDDEIRAMISKHFRTFELAHVPGFKLTDDDGNETGECTQYIRVIAKK